MHLAIEMTHGQKNAMLVGSVHNRWYITVVNSLLIYLDSAFMERILDFSLWRKICNGGNNVMPMSNRRLCNPTLDYSKFILSLLFVSEIRSLFCTFLLALMTKKCYITT
jgi:hypothetical protein